MDGREAKLLIGPIFQKVSEHRFHPGPRSVGKKRNGLQPFATVKPGIVSLIGQPRE
jgi:hypothetical protein